jgi:hypothetical protein
MTLFLGFQFVSLPGGIRANHEADHVSDGSYDLM